MRTLTQSINWAKTYLGYPSLVASPGQDPAVSAASMIRSCIVAPPLSWFWNRGEASFPLIKGQQDYIETIPDFGWIETASLTDSNGNIFVIKDVRSIGTVSQAADQQRPNEVGVLEAGTVMFSNALQFAQQTSSTLTLVFFSTTNFQVGQNLLLQVTSGPTWLNGQTITILTLVGNTVTASLSYNQWPVGVDFVAHQLTTATLAYTISGGPTTSVNETAFVISSNADFNVIAPSFSVGWTQNTSISYGAYGWQNFTTLGVSPSATVTDVSTHNYNAFMFSIFGNVQPVKYGGMPNQGGSGGSVQSGSAATLLSHATTSGNSILVVILNDVQLSGPATPAFTISDSQGNSYQLIGYTQNATYPDSVAMAYIALNITGGTTTHTWTSNLVHPGNGTFYVTEVSNVEGASLATTGQGTAVVNGGVVFRFIGAPNEAYTADIVYQKRAVNMGPYPITAVGNASGGHTAYIGSFDPVAFPAGATAQITSCTNSVNNGAFTVVSCTYTALTVSNGVGTAEVGSSGYAANFDWAPIPDGYIDVYNVMFLADMMADSGYDQEALAYRQRGIARLLAKSQGLTDMQKNEFMQQWLARLTEEGSKAVYTQQGVQSRRV